MAKKMKPIRHEWTDKEIKLLKKLFPVKPTKEVAEIMGLTLPTVIRRAYIMGLQKKIRKRYHESKS